jgi:hypothetical protein
MIALKPRLFLVMLAALAIAGRVSAAALTYPLTVVPPEHKMMKDPITGAELVFVSAGPAKDHNLYFHQRSWLSDDSMVLFMSQRRDGGLLGYLFATGELVRLVTLQGGLGNATAARSGNRIFAARGRDIIELSLRIHASPDASKYRSLVTATERLVCTLPPGANLGGYLSENSDGTLLGLALRHADGKQSVAVADIKTGLLREVCRYDFAGHLQFSITNPNLLSVAGLKDRLVVIDLARGGEPRSIHRQAPGEWVTHECWWIGDSLTFCGGYRDKESDVKVINAHTGEVRIVGAGAWVPWSGNGDDVLNRWNWWHAAGHESGRRIVADNWYGDIVVFDGHTTQMHRLTLGHRKYGGGIHPEPGWDRSGRRVVFNSQVLGGEHVCIATLPTNWPPDPATEGLVITGGVEASTLPRNPSAAPSQ